MAGKEIFIEHRAIVRLSCYKFFKFAPPKGAPLVDQLAARERQRCPYGFESIQPTCQNCIWFKRDQVNMDDKPIITDRVIDPQEIAALGAEFKAIEQKAEEERTKEKAK